MKIPPLWMVVFLATGTILVIYLVVERWGNRTAQQSAHRAFVGSAPAPSKPYTILDYTKPAP